MRITGMNPMSKMGNVRSVQNNKVGDFAETLAKTTEQVQDANADAKLKATCKDMEALFLNMMMTEMRKTVHKSKLVDSSKEEIMTSMLDSEMTKNMASAGGMGLADMLYRQLRMTANTVKRTQAPQ